MKRSPHVAAPSRRRASKRANALIEAMLKEMQRGLRDPHHLDSPEWERLFGAKQSMVVNLQKLVQALASLPEAEAGQAGRTGKPEPVDTLSAEEMRLLTQWIAEREANQ